MECIKDFPLDRIKVLNEYKSTTPAAYKFERTKRKYLNNGKIPSNIIINSDNVLVDGYTTYLFALSQGIESVDVNRGCIEVVKAIHFVGSSKVFQWRVPSRLCGKIQEGDRVLVRTSRGVQRVIVTEIMQLQYPEHNMRLKRVIRLCN